MKKVISLAIVGLMMSSVKTQFGQEPVCFRTCICDDGNFPCGSCANPGLQLPSIDGTRCFLCPGALCTSCSADYVCNTFIDCPNANQKPDIIGSECVTCDITNCTNCFFPDICQKCQSGYRLNNDGGCQIIPECKVQNCDLCFQDQLTQCRICADGFFRNANNKCSDERCVTQGCLECQFGNNFQCKTCNTQAGYIKVGNTCVLRCKANDCKTCVTGSATECAECNFGFGLHFSQGVQANCKRCFAQNCDVCRNNSFTKCIQCKPKFMLGADGKCTPKV